MPSEWSGISHLKLVWGVSSRLKTAPRAEQRVLQRLALSQDMGYASGAVLCGRLVWAAADLHGCALCWLVVFAGVHLALAIQ